MEILIPKINSSISGIANNKNMNNINAKNANFDLMQNNIENKSRISIDPPKFMLNFNKLAKDEEENYENYESADDNENDNPEIMNNILKKIHKKIIIKIFVTLEIY